MLSFLEEHTSEIENMLFGEWDMDIALEVAKEEALAEGLQQGEARMNRLFALLESGVSLDEAKKRFNSK